MEDVRKLTELLERFLQDADQTDIHIGELSPPYQALGEAVGLCLKQMQEIYRFTAEIADGELSVPVPDRHNYLAGPIKDLYYKLQHMAWQAKQIAKGDYSRQVDFRGSFSESFNVMTTELKHREQTIRRQAEEQLKSAERQNAILQRQMVRQIAHYQSYRNYTSSFRTFREQYKKMMGQVYDLFSQGKYEEGRLLISHINDMMGSEIAVCKTYSNHELVDSSLVDTAGYCQHNGVSFRAQVYIPAELRLPPELVQQCLMYYSDLLFSLLDTGKSGERSLSISGGTRNSWLTIRSDYYSAGGKFPSMNGEQTSEKVFAENVRRMQTLAVENNAIFDIQYHTERSRMEILLHINIESFLDEQH